MEFEDLTIEKSEVLTSGSWHTNLKITYENSSFYLTNTPSGCGAQTLHGYYAESLTVIKQMLSLILAKVKGKKYQLVSDKKGYYSRNDIGMISTTLGETFYKGWLPIFEELGFKKVSEYPNPRHNGELQCLLVWTIND